MSNSNHEKPFILLVNGSPRKSGHVSNMLLNVRLRLEKRGAKTQTIHLADYKILPPDGRLNEKIAIEKTQDDMPKLQRLALRADGIIFATPTHWFNVSSLMKLFLDRLTSLEHYNFLLEGKVAGFVVYGPQAGALNAAMLLTMTANHMGMAIPPYAAIFDEGRDDKWIKKEYDVLAKNMVQQIRAWRELQLNWGYADVKYKISPIELLPKNRK